MTRFTVVWKREADDELADIWLEATVRNAVNVAAAAIDHELADDPAAKGEAVKNGLFKLVIRPLAVLFSISDDDRLVRVQAVQTVIFPRRFVNAHGNGSPLHELLRARPAVCR